jgi:hypothetical protein
MIVTNFMTVYTQAQFAQAADSHYKGPHLMRGYNGYWKAGVNMFLYIIRWYHVYTV